VQEKPHKEWKEQIAARPVKEKALRKDREEDEPVEMVPEELDDDRDDDFESSESDDDLTKASHQELPAIEDQKEAKAFEEIKQVDNDFVGIYSDEDSDGD
jgi:hypothetical protein